MKIFILTGLFLLTTPVISLCQNIGIGTTLPHASSALDITSTNKGLLIPRMTSTGITAIPSPAKGLMIYDSTLNQLMVNMGTPATPNWQTIVASSGWGLSGNAGTNPTTQFVGTTDNIPLRFRVNNKWAGQVDSSTRHVSFGFGAGQNNASSVGNIAIGNASMKSNSAGNLNVVIGDSAAYAMTAGDETVFIGNFAGRKATSLTSYAIAIGSHSADSNCVARTTIVGNYAGRKNQIEGNVMVGSGAGMNTTTGIATFVGNNAGISNTTGTHNTFIGAKAGDANTIGSYNTALGSNSLLMNINGSDNTATGYASLNLNTTGISNTANGSSALSINTTGSFNSAFGSEALFSNATGAGNTAHGFAALYANTTGSNNTANGFQSLQNNTSGEYNTANGSYTLSSNTTGSYNTANGKHSLYLNATGNDNTACGYYSLFSNSTGSFSVGIGDYTLERTTGALYNTAIGYNAGAANDNGYNNVFVGANTDVSGAGYYNVIAIGQGTICTSSSQVTIGNGATGSYRAYANWSNISDGRFKKNIKENVPGLDFILQLRPVTYNLNATALDAFSRPNTTENIQSSVANNKAINGQPATKIPEQSFSDDAKSVYNNALKEKEAIVYSGFVAQEVEAAAKKLGFEFSGIDAPKNTKDVYGLRYSEFVVPLVKAVQELDTSYKKQQQQITALNNTIVLMQKQIDALKVLIKK